ncbi:hypothetical protein [Streptomyces sp. Amel2xB2]|nr:hypothetical protein [Streptomyces sp. Amel2xB2]
MTTRKLQVPAHAKITEFGMYGVKNAAPFPLHGKGIERGAEEAPEKL